MMQAIRDFVLKRRNAYKVVFNSGPASDIVLSDLRKFCRATTTPAVVSPETKQIDPMATGIAIGRQEVWHRIMLHIHMPDSDIYKLNQFDQGE